MKRIIALVLTVAILLISMQAGVIAVASDGAQSGTAWVYEFNSKSKVEGKITAPNAEVDYDVGENAMRLKAKESTLGNSTLWIMHTPIQNISVEDYNYLAMLVKVKSDNIADFSVRLRATSSNNPKETKTAYKDTDGWQLVYYDITNEKFVYTSNPPVYSGVEAIMADWTGADASMDDIFYVGWIGGFASVADIYKYSGRVNCFEGANVISFGDIYDGGDKANGVSVSTIKEYSSFSYTQNALFYSPTEQSRGQDNRININCSDLNISATNYPVVAFKAKWGAVPTHIITNYMRVSDGTVESYQSDTGVRDNWIVAMSHTDTDWQTVYYDFSGRLENHYTTLVLTVTGAYSVKYNASYATNPESEPVMPVYIDWVGFFKTAEDAYAYETERAIDKVSDIITSADGELIETANNLYNGLSDNLKEKVSNADELESINKIFAVSKSIDKALNSYSKRVTGEENEELDSIEKSFRSLSFEERNRVYGYSEFSSLLKLSSIANEIYRLPDVITWSQKVAIKNIDTAYSALGEEQRGIISNYNKYLISKEQYESIRLKDKYDLNIDDSINILDFIRLKKSFVLTDAVVYTTDDINSDGESNAEDTCAFAKMLLFVNTEKSAEELSNNIKINTENMSIIDTETFTIYDYNSERKFNHGAYINYFNGKFYAFWQQGYLSEDCCGQRIVYATSADGENWSEAQDFIPVKIDKNGNEMLLNPFGTYVNSENQLVVYVYEYAYDAEALANSTQGEGILRPDNSESSSSKTDISFYCMYTSDGVNWERGTDIPSNSGGNRDPHILPSGRLMWAGWHTVAFSDDLSGKEWTPTGLSYEQVKDAMERGKLGQFTEAAAYQSADNIVHLLMRTGSGKLWGSSSRDNGTTFSEAFETSFTDDSQKFDFINLPDGRVLYIGTPIYSGKHSRIPLVAAISEDGYNFNKACIIGNEEYTSQGTDSTKLGNYSYPSACVVGDEVYVIYAKQKEIIEVTRFKLSDLE